MMPTNMRGRSGWGKNSGSTTSVPAGYKSCKNSFSNKINSFKTLFGQTQGAAKFGRPTPSTLNSFANWINKGAIIQTVSCTQVAKWAKATRKSFSTRNPSPTSCKNILSSKFGKTTIKAVARTKTGSFMVVTSPTKAGRPFCFPK